MLRLRIKEIAEEKDISQSKLSRLADIGYSTVRRIFDDPYCSISIDTLNKIARALNVPALSLLEEVEENHAE
jgi:transcriptional regulator with XRE-family HTH domain